MPKRKKPKNKKSIFDKPVFTIRFVDSNGKPFKKNIK